MMLNRAVDLLGPDIELLTEILMELGRKHVVYGVKACHYDPMGRALISTLQEILGDRFTQQHKDSWLEVYQALSNDMISMYGCGPERSEELFSTATIVTEASCLF
jgi:hemoglobin-like flavoprotein